MDKNGVREEILVVDDNVNTSTVISNMLKSFGFCVKIANSAQEAMKITNEEYPNLTLIDLRMSEMASIELMHRIKEKNPRIPVVIYSGSPSLRTIEKAFREGVADYILKPFDLNDFKSTITKILKNCCQDKSGVN